MKNVIQWNFGMHDLAGGAITGAAANAATGMVGGGNDMIEKLWKGALAGAAIIALAPTGKNLAAMVLPKPKAAEAPAKK